MKPARQKVTYAVLDFLLSPLVLPAAALLGFVRHKGVHRLPLCRRIFQRLGVFPVRDHYYDPYVNPRRLRRSLREDRPLPGINWNTDEQLGLLAKFDFNGELEQIPVARPSGAPQTEFFYNNGAFMSGDAEFYYSVIRHFKPRRVIEIGSGFSTMMALKAIRKNQAENPSHACELSCIEPFEKVLPQGPELRLIRQRVERLDSSVFTELERHDILFIDSSHMIKPQGDVLFEFLEVLPILRAGVLVHVHDVFCPKDYPAEWVSDYVRFWNEQYLLEAFMSGNREYRIIGALNYLRHHHTDAIAARCPILKRQLPDREPGSFWLMRNEPLGPHEMRA